MPTIQTLNETSTPGSLRKWRSSIVTLLSLSAGWCSFLCAWTWGYVEDDSFIHLEFARNFAHGLGFSFNGHVVYGDTAPLWVFFLAAVHLLVPDWLHTSKLLAILGLLFAASGVYFFTTRLQGSLRPRSPLLPSAFVLFFVLNPFVSYWSFSGMETVAACGLTFWLAGLACGEPLSSRGFLLACAGAGLAPVLRPELLFLSLLLAPLLLYRWRKLSGPPSHRMRLLLAGACLISTPALLWAAYALRTFGALIPNTNAAKRAPLGDSVLHRLLNVYAVGFPLIFVLVPVLLLFAAATYFGIPRRSLHNDRPHRAPFSTFVLPQPPALAFYLFFFWTLLAAAFYIRDHTYVQTRYILVSAPGLLLASLLMLRTFSPRVAIAAWTFGIAMSLAVMARMGLPALHNKAEYVAATRRLALFIRDRVPSGAPVAAYAIGELAFYSGHPIIDTGGITRPGVIPYLNTGDDSGIIAWGKREGAQYWVYDHPPEPGSTLAFSQTAPQSTTWDYHPGIYKSRTVLALWALPSQSPSPPHPVNP